MSEQNGIDVEKQNYFIGFVLIVCYGNDKSDWSSAETGHRVNLAYCLTQTVLKD